MEILGERPVCSMSDSEQLSALDAAVAEHARMQTLIWQLTASLDASGYAKDLGAADTARLLSDRYRLDLKDARREVRLANRLTTYSVTGEALPDPAVPFQNPAHATADEPVADPPGETAADTDAAASAADDADDAGAAEAAGHGWRVNPAQAAAIVAVLDQVPNTVPAADLAIAEQELIGLAVTHTPAQLRRAGRRIRDILDPDGPEPDEKAAYDRESLSLQNADRGVKFHGYLANENAELLRTLIRAHARPHKTVDGELDPRPLTKRQADALTTILNTPGQTLTAPATNHTRTTATHPINRTNPAGDTATYPSGHSREDVTGDEADSATGTAAGSTPTSGDADVLSFPPTRSSHHREPERPTGPDSPAEPGEDAHDNAPGNARNDVVPGHGPKPHISITINYNDLIAATTNAIGHSNCHGTGALVFGEDLSAATVRRLACDAEVLPIVLGSKSQPLDVGTTQRLVTRPMRRALNARDKGCVICGAPPAQTEAHHIIHWADGGPTAVTNLALLCKRHHIDLHEGHWQIRIVNGIVEVTRPTWSNPTYIPPGKYQPPTAAVVHTPLTPTNPWHDDHRPTPPTNPRPLVPHNPWGDEDLPVPRSSPGPLVPLDPWGDEEVPAPRSSPRPRVPHDPWGEEDVPAPDASSDPSEHDDVLALHTSAPSLVPPWREEPPSPPTTSSSPIPRVVRGDQAPEATSSPTPMEAPVDGNLPVRPALQGDARRSLGTDQWGDNMSA